MIVNGFLKSGVFYSKLNVLFIFSVLRIVLWCVLLGFLLGLVDVMVKGLVMLIMYERMELLGIWIVMFFFVFMKFVVLFILRFCS